jgi:hypothetical protein
VKTIEAYAESMTPSEEVKEKIELTLGENDDARLHMLNELSCYRPDLMSIIVPPLYHKYPSLRTILFGTPYSTSDEMFIGQPWIIRIPPRNPPTKMGSFKLNSLGHITVYHRVLQYLGGTSHILSPIHSSFISIHNRGPV